MKLPDVYGPQLFDQKVDAIFEHIYASYFDNGQSVYDTPDTHTTTGTAVATLPTTPEQVTDDLLTHVRTDPELFARLMETVFGTNATWACSTQELLANDETRVVEYKQTARWNVREQRRDKSMEQLIVKTVAGLLNDRGGTLLIGVHRQPRTGRPRRRLRPRQTPNADGYVNWLDTLFENHLGHAGANRLDIRHRPHQQPRHLPHRHPPPAPAPCGSRKRKVPTPSTSAATTPPDKYQPTRSKPSSPSDSDSKNQAHRREFLRRQAPFMDIRLIRGYRSLGR